MESVSTYQKDLIRPGRLVGNTTRQVDFAIQQLFAGNTVEIIDHASVDYGVKRGEANRRLCNLILKRLMTDHGVSIESGDVIIGPIKSNSSAGHFVTIKLTSYG